MRPFTLEPLYKEKKVKSTSGRYKKKVPSDGGDIKATEEVLCVEP